MKHRQNDSTLVLRRPVEITRKRGPISINGGVRVGNSCAFFIGIGFVDNALPDPAANATVLIKPRATNEATPRPIARNTFNLPIDICFINTLRYQTHCTHARTWRGVVIAVTFHAAPLS
jgi:hypothetical protein